MTTARPRPERRGGLLLVALIGACVSNGDGGSTAADDGRALPTSDQVIMAMAGQDDFLVLTHPGGSDDEAHRDGSGPTQAHVVRVEADGDLAVEAQAEIAPTLLLDPTAAQSADGTWLVLGIQCPNPSDGGYVPACDPGTATIAALDPDGMVRFVDDVPDALHRTQGGLRGISGSHALVATYPDDDSELWRLDLTTLEFDDSPVPSAEMPASWGGAGATPYRARTECLRPEGIVTVDQRIDEAGGLAFHLGVYSPDDGTQREERPLVNGVSMTLGWLMCPPEGEAYLVSVDEVSKRAVAISLEHPDPPLVNDPDEPHATAASTWYDVSSVTVQSFLRPVGDERADAVDTTGATVGEDGVGVLPPLDVTIPTRVDCLCGGGWQEIPVEATLDDRVHVLPDASATLIVTDHTTVRGWHR